MIRNVHRVRGYRWVHHMQAGVGYCRVSGGKK